MRLFPPIPAIVAAMLFLGAPPSVAQQSGAVEFARSEVIIEVGDARHRFTVEVAQTSEQRARGLMFRTELAADAGAVAVTCLDTDVDETIAANIGIAGSAQATVVVIGVAVVAKLTRDGVEDAIAASLKRAINVASRRLAARSGTVAVAVLDANVD